VMCKEGIKIMKSKHQDLANNTTKNFYLTMLCGSISKKKLNKLIKNRKTITDAKINNRMMNDIACINSENRERKQQNQGKLEYWMEVWQCSNEFNIKRFSSYQIDMKKLKI